MEVRREKKICMCDGRRRGRVGDEDVENERWTRRAWRTDYAKREIRRRDEVKGVGQHV